MVNLRLGLTFSNNTEGTCSEVEFTGFIWKLNKLTVLLLIFHKPVRTRVGFNRYLSVSTIAGSFYVLLNV